MAAYDFALFNKIKDDEDRCEFVKSVIPKMKWEPDELVLDIGSGPGGATRNMLWPLLQPYEIKGIIGVDCDNRMVIESSEKCSIEGKIDFYKANIEDRRSFPVEWQNRFHKCFSFFVFQDISRMRSALNNVNWLLKTGGECCLILASYTPHTEAHLELFREPAWETFSQDVTPTCVNEIFCSKDVDNAFKTLLKQCGFDVKGCYESERTREFKTADDYMDFMMGVDLNLKQISEDLQEDYRKEMYKKLIKIPFISNHNSDDARPVIDENGVHLQHQKILHVHATKITHAFI